MGIGSNWFHLHRTGVSSEKENAECIIPNEHNLPMPELRPFTPCALTSLLYKSKHTVSADRSYLVRRTAL